MRQFAILGLVPMLSLSACGTDSVGRDGSRVEDAVRYPVVKTVDAPKRAFRLNNRRGVLIEENVGAPIARGVLIAQNATSAWVWDQRAPRLLEVGSDQWKPLQPVGQLAYVQEVHQPSRCPRWGIPFVSHQSPTDPRMAWHAKSPDGAPSPAPLPLLARYEDYDLVGFADGPHLLSRHCSRDVKPLPRPMVLVRSGVGGCVLDATSAHGPDAIVTRLSFVDPELNCVTASVDQPREYDRPDPDMRAHDKYLAQSDIVYELQEQVADAVADSESEGRVVLVLSGAHTTAVGTVAGVVRNHPDARVGLIWIDAHPDINTPGSTLSGNPHGMPVAAMAGLAYPDDVAWWPRDNPVDPATFDAINEHWALYHQELMSGHTVALDDILFVGIRDIDPWEEFIIRDRNIAVASVEATRQSREAVVEQAKRVMQGCDVIVINIDVDVLDTQYATGTGTPVPGGLEPDELYELAGLLVENFSDRIAAIELTETDPMIDTGAQVQTLDYAVELTQTLLSKLHTAGR